MQLLNIDTILDTASLTEDLGLTQLLNEFGEIGSVWENRKAIQTEWNGLSAATRASILADYDDYCDPSMRYWDQWCAERGIADVVEDFH